MKKICACCGTEFEIIGDTPNNRRRKYCTKACRIKVNNRTNKNRKLVPLKNFVCSVCGKPYITNRSDSMTCSRECQYERGKLLARERNQRAKEIEERFLDDYQKSKPKPKKVTPGWEIEAEARKVGMNYGQYYALMLQKKEIEERERRKKGEQR